MTNVVTNILISVFLEIPTNTASIAPVSFQYENAWDGPGFISRWVKDQPDTGLQRIPRAKVSHSKREEPERYPLQ